MASMLFLRGCCCGNVIFLRFSLFERGVIVKILNSLLSKILSVYDTSYL